MALVLETPFTPGTIGTLSVKNRVMMRMKRSPDCYR
jgi:hypothetical protein